MDNFEAYIENVDHPAHQKRIKEILDWISTTYPNLEKKIAWNQPHFVNQGTFILGLSHAKEHVAFAPEHVAILKFKDLAEKNGYTVTSQIFRIKWNQDIDYNLLKQIIDFNIEEKKGCKTYWRSA